MNRVLFIGQIGSDAGGWWIGPDGKVHKVPGWGVDQLREVSHLARSLQSISQLKTPGLSERVGVALVESLHKALEGHVKEGDVVVLG
ncbi:MAG: hypothetical protein QOE68_4766 [Thermoanaerobaculia bacterium]|jgi:hypothetical protein|nr:hypothetical protein [Thermoanaerobaculia bacterium]